METPAMNNEDDLLHITSTARISVLSGGSSSRHRGIRDEDDNNLQYLPADDDHVRESAAINKKKKNNKSHNINANSRSILTPVTLCILGTETAERFAYFGFRAVLVLYFTMALQYTESQAIALFAFNSSLAYFSPLLGAVLADGWLGRYRTILYFGTVYVVGLAVLAAAAGIPLLSLPWKRFLTFAGLFLVCMGTGGIKPCVSAFGADQVYLSNSNNRNSCSSSSSSTHPGERKEKGERTCIGDDDNDEPEDNHDDDDYDDPEHVRSEQVRTFFNYFYFCINVGAVTSIALVPIVRAVSGFGLAFAFPCFFMTGAMLLFLSKRRDYIHQDVTVGGGHDNRMLTTFRLAWGLLIERLYSYRWVASNCSRFQPIPVSRPRRLVPTSDRMEEEDRAGEDIDPTEDEAAEARWKELMDDAAQTLNILPVLAMFPVFWTLYDQQGSVWTLQATRMYLPMGMQPEQMNIINPVQILLFVPLFQQVVYPYLEGRGFNISPLRRMSWGMVFAAVAFFISGLVESSIQRHEETGEKVNVFAQIPQITVLAVAEILLSVTGLEFSYACSPDRIKAAVTALFLSTTGIGDCFSGILYSTVFENMNRASAMHVCGVLMLCNLRLFLWVARWYEGRGRELRRESDRAPAEAEDESADFELQVLRGEVL